MNLSKRSCKFWTWFAGEYAIEKLIDCQLGIENGVGFLWFCSSYIYIYIHICIPTLLLVLILKWSHITGCS